MSFIFTFPRQQAFDSSGNTLAGAKLFFYDAGTSNLKNVFADVFLSTVLSNPVIADGSGRFPEIYLDDSLYKIKLTDSNDNLLYTTDNYIAQPTESDVSFIKATVDKVITSAGITPSENNSAQLGQAIYKYATAGQYFTDEGTDDNSYDLKGVNSYDRPNDYFTGMSVYFVCTRPNTGSATVNVESLGDKNIRRFDGTDLHYGDLEGIVHLVYNGTVFLLANNDKTELPRFCVNSGNLNSAGNGDLLSIVGSNIVFKVGNNYPSITVTNTRGETAIIDHLEDLPISGNGTHYIYTDLLGNVSETTAPLTVGKVYPSGAKSGQVFLDVSGVPIAKTYSGTNWETFYKIPLGKVTVSNGSLTNTETFPYNYDRYNLTVNQQQFFAPMPTTDEGIGQIKFINGNTLPAGGLWVYWAHAVLHAGATDSSRLTGGIAKGGTKIEISGFSADFTIVCWRIE